MCTRRKKKGACKGLTLDKRIDGMTFERIDGMTKGLTLDERIDGMTFDAASHAPLIVPIRFAQLGNERKGSERRCRENGPTGDGMEPQQ